MGDYLLALPTMGKQTEEQYIPGQLGGGDDFEIDRTMTDLAGSPPHTPNWKKYIGHFDRPDAQPLQGLYAREGADDKHRLGDLLGLCLTAYVQKHPEDQEGANLLQWLDNMPDWDRVMMISRQAAMRNPVTNQQNKVKDEYLRPSMVKMFMNGVRYLDKEGRKSCKVSFDSGNAYLDVDKGKKPLDTSHMSTVFSGQGFGIWVMSNTGRLYVGSHVKGQLHHSSFLAGADVMCGGELWARKGAIAFLTAKSGHYKPTIEHLTWALQVLQTCVNNYDHIKVMVWKKILGTLVVVPPNKIVSNPSYYAAWGTILQSEKSHLRQGKFDSFPQS